MQRRRIWSGGDAREDDSLRDRDLCDGYVLRKRECAKDERGSVQCDVCASARSVKQKVRNE